MNSNLTLEQLKEDKALLFDTVDFLFGFKLRFYQLTFLTICLKYNRISGKWCRQAGKSQCIAFYIVLVSMLAKKATIIASPTQTQSDELFLKIKNLVNDTQEITALIKKETQTELIWVSGSRIISLPCGPEGRTLRGHTCDILIIEEAGLMKDIIINTVLVPMLASKGDKGQIIKIGTPLTRNHFFRSCFEDKNYHVVNVTWHDCVKAGQYTQAFVDEQMAELTDIEFKTEYLGEFIDTAMMFFPMTLLDKCMRVYTLLPQI